MKKILFIILLLSITFIPLFAKNFYINVGYVSDTNTFKNVRYYLNKSGYKIYSTRYKKGYIVYAGPFERNKLDEVLSKIKKNISINACMVDLIIKDREVISEKKISTK